MNRRTFFATFGLPLTINFPERRLVLSHHGKQIFLLCTYITGMQYYDGDETFLEGLREGDSLKLVREPANKYDAKAIEVRTPSGLKIGYIPQADNPVLANLADGGQSLLARVVKIKQESWPWRCVKININLRKR